MLPVPTLIVAFDTDIAAATSYRWVSEENPLETFAALRVIYCIRADSPTEVIDKESQRRRKL